MDIAIHICPTLTHQGEHGQWFLEGFKHLGIKARVTHNPEENADIHIVSGPHFAKRFWLNHPRTILLDRAYWHEEKTGLWKSMDWVSLGWLRKDGGRRFTSGNGRRPPRINLPPDTGGTIFLADFNGPLERADTIRLHPANEKPNEGLAEVLRKHRIAIGYTTSALVAAGLEGLEVVCKDKRNIMSEPNWLELLPYADWHYSEIQSGEAWDE